MNRRTLCWIGGIFGLVLIAALVVLVFFQRRAQRELERQFPPDGIAQGKVWQAKSVRVSLWRRRVEFEGLRVAQPSGFGTGAVFRARTLSVAFPFSVLFNPRTLHFREVQFEDAAIVLVRDTTGRWNIEAFSQGDAKGADLSAVSAGVEGEKGASDGGRISQEKKTSLPPLVLGRTSGQLMIRIRDHRAHPELRDLRMRFAIAGTNLTTVPMVASDESEWGVLTGRGSIEWQGSEAPTEWVLRIAPGLSDGKVSFDFSAVAEEVPKAWAASLVGETLNVTGRVDRIRATAALSVRENQFDVNRSRLIFQLSDVRVGKRTVPEMTLPIPVGGTLERPELQLEPALAALGAQLLQMELRDRLSR